MSSPKTLDGVSPVIRRGGQGRGAAGAPPLCRRVLSVTAERLQALSRAVAKDVIGVAGGRQKVGAIRGALAGRFLNVLITDEDTALALVGSKSRG